MLHEAAAKLDARASEQQVMTVAERKGQVRLLQRATAH
jgi:hypothetical protein